MQCKARVAIENERRTFGDPRYNFYLEFRCPYTIEDDSPSTNSRCKRCDEKRETCREQWSRKFEHGNIDEELPPKSHIFGSEWFNEALKKYGLPTNRDIHIAMEHQARARKGKTAAAASKEEDQVTKDVVDNVVEDLTKLTVKEKKETKKRTTKASTTTTTTPAEQSTEQHAETKPKKGRKKKEDPPVLTPISDVAPFKDIHVDNSSTNIQYKEQPNSTPSTYDNIEVVEVHLFNHSGKKYYRDYRKNKLYEYKKESVGKYVGRWNSETETLEKTIADSDCE
jgi:hypothetical protein